MGLMKKLKNRYFLILKFCFHEATLQAYLARSVCAMDMVDSALKTLDLALLKYDKSFGTYAHKTRRADPPLGGSASRARFEMYKQSNQYIRILITQNTPTVIYES